MNDAIHWRLVCQAQVSVFNNLAPKKRVRYFILIQFFYSSRYTDFAENTIPIKKIPNNNKDDTADHLIMHLKSFYIFIVFNFYILCFLSNYLTSGNNKNTLSLNIVTISDIWHVSTGKTTLKQLSKLIPIFSEGNQLDGLLFLLSTLIVNTCLIFHYPIQTLSKSGLSKLSSLLWIFVFSSVSIFLFLLRNCKLKQNMVRFKTYKTIFNTSYLNLRQPCEF